MAAVLEGETMEFLQSNIAVVAAVVVGTVSGAAFLLSRPSSTSTPATSNRAPAAQGDTSGSTEKKKKKKKKKTKASKGAQEGAAKSESDGGDVESDGDDLPDPLAAAASKGASKKKAKKTGAAPSAAAQKTKAGKQAPEVVEAAAPAPAAAAPARIKDDEGAWETAKPAKKKNAAKKPEAKAAAKAAAAAAAGPGETNSVKSKVEVPSKLLGVLIGPGGETLHKLQDATGTKINTPNKGDSTGPTSLCWVEGPSDGVATCVRAIKDLTTKGYSSITHPNSTEGSVQMWPLYFPILIGKEGAGIRRLQDAFGIKVVMPEKRFQTDNKPAYVKLVGSKSSVDKAKAEIKQMMRCYYFPSLSPELTHVELDLGDGQLRDLIGHRGMTIKSIQGDTRCKIHTPRPNALVQKVVVVGTPADIARAQKQIDRAIERASENREARYNERFDDYADDYSDDEAW